jgi:hypothetical protein
VRIPGEGPQGRNRPCAEPVAERQGLSPGVEHDAPKNQLLARGRVRPWSHGLTMPADLPAGHLLPHSARPRRPDLASSGRTGRVLRVLPTARPALDGRGEVAVRPEEVIEPVRIMGVLHAGHHQWDRYGGHVSDPGADHGGGTR